MSENLADDGLPEGGRPAAIVELQASGARAGPDAAHAFVRSAIAAGTWADFTSQSGYDPGNKPVVEAVFLRRLLLGLETAGEDSDEVLSPVAGLRLRGARITGKFDLTDCAGLAGAALPALLLESCDLPDELDLSGAWLARLSISGSRFRFLVGMGVRVDGSVDFSNTVPLPMPESQQEVAVVHLPGARVEGDIKGSGARLSKAHEHALFLHGAEVGGDIDLDAGFASTGTIWLSNLSLAGMLSCYDARLQNPNGFALLAENARIGGAVLLRGPDGIAVCGKRQSQLSERTHWREYRMQRGFVRLSARHRLADGKRNDWRRGLVAGISRYLF